MPQHQVPAEFKHYVKFPFHDSKLFRALFSPYTTTEQGFLAWTVPGIQNLVSVQSMPMTGPITINDETKAYVHNQEKQGFVYVWFKTADEFLRYVDLYNSRQKVVEQAKHNRMYRMDQYGRWGSHEMYPVRDRSTYVGYNHYLDMITHDIKTYQTHQDILRRLGEGKSLNYLLYGLPGTGKTSLIMTLASENDYPVYYVGGGIREYSIIAPAISSGLTNASGIKILLFEDFDRFLEGIQEEGKGKNSGYMSDILNTLDGFQSGEGIIRFFTGNDCEAIMKNAALINRMSACYKFGMPLLIVCSILWLKLCGYCRQFYAT